MRRFAWLVVGVLLVAGGCGGKKEQPAAERPEAAAPEKHAAKEGLVPAGWFSVQDESGVANPNYKCLLTGAWMVRKKLVLKVSPDKIAAARVAYHMAQDPYFPGQKGSSMLHIALNGELLLEDNVQSVATKGWHAVDMPPNRLIEGDNVVEFRVSGPTYVYLSVDPGGKARRSCASVDGGATWNCDVLAANNLYELQKNRKLKPPRGGEYMVRLIYEPK